MNITKQKECKIFKVFSGITLECQIQMSPRSVKLFVPKTEIKNVLYCAIYCSTTMVWFF